MITWVRMFNKNHYKWESRQKLLQKIFFQIFEKSYQKWGKHVKIYYFEEAYAVFTHKVIISLGTQHLKNIKKRPFYVAKRALNIVV
jgi:hypothetical protein